MLKVIYHALAVKEVHGRCQPIPVQRLSESESSSTTRDVRDRNNLFEGYNLHRSHDCNNIDVSHEHSAEECAYHYKRPYRSSDEGLLLLFIFGYRGLL